jgi:hypothetical protein
MSLADFFRRHRNVLEADYGERAVEERRSSGARRGFRGVPLQAAGAAPLVDVSEDRILEISEDGAEEDKPPRRPAS